MSTIITRTGADYSANSTRFIAPVPSGLLVWNYFGALGADDPATAALRSARNLSGSANIVTLIGAPTVGSGFVTLDGTHSILTDVAETLSYTYIVLVVPSAVNARFIGNFGAPTGTSGTMLYAPNGTFPALQMNMIVPNSVSGTPGQTVLVGPAASPTWPGMKMVSGKFDNATLTGTVRNLTDGTSASAVIPGSRVLRTVPAPITLGGISGFAAASNFGFCAIYNRALSTAEENAVRTTVAAYRLAKYGDVI